MKTSVVGYPRIGANRELKFATESYFRNQITAEELKQQARFLRAAHWGEQKKSGIDWIPSNDFSYYDAMLDTAILFDLIPARYRALHLSALDTLFAMARGYQGVRGDVKALGMKKWFNTNYHYMVPEIDDATRISLAGSKPFDEYAEAIALGITTKPVLIGPFTLLKLARYTGKKGPADFALQIARAYKNALCRFQALGTEWVQLDEPYLVRDLTAEDIALFEMLYCEIFAAKGTVKVLLQTYFGDIRDCYAQVMRLPFDGIGLDFVEGRETLKLLETNGFPAEKTLFAGVVNGKNIWRNDYTKTLKLLQRLRQITQSLVVGASCSLLHVPYSLEGKSGLSSQMKAHLAFAAEKLNELTELGDLADVPQIEDHPSLKRNAALFSKKRGGENEGVREKVRAVSEADCARRPSFYERERIQKQMFRLPLLPTTTIGSFPQTTDVKANRTALRRKTISQEEYQAFNRKKIAECVALQEEIGLDVLVHGEFERNDMVEYFAERLNGFLFTEKAWVQSYGTRCVKPPIIWGDISRDHPITVEWSIYAQSLTSRPMKGMLTGPVTILNWSFPREDIPLSECAFQIALAIRQEVLDLEAAGIRIIQIDEAALREKLPLRKTDWQQEYLRWAIPAFRFTHSGVLPQTQIHTHMCYSEFGDIIDAIDEMDADVITFEASRSNLSILDALQKSGFKTEVGPGVYDIHSPRVPSVEEIANALRKMLEKIPAEKLWVNPDCGLKTRGTQETQASLIHLVRAAREVRNENN